MVSIIEIKSGFLRIKNTIKEHLKYEQYSKYYNAGFWLLLLILIPIIINIEEPKKGCVSGDCQNGQGTLIFEVGGKYTGGFVNGHSEGQGVYLSANGIKYTGSFVNDNYEGQGVYISANGDKYTGSFVNGQFEGQGVYVSSSEKYTGDFVNGQYEGQGVYVSANGDKYTGGFVNGQAEGKGVYVSANGTRKQGEFKNNKYVGNTELEKNLAISAATATAERLAEQKLKAFESTAKVASEAIKLKEITLKCSAEINQCKSQCEDLPKQVDQINEHWYGDDKTSPRGRCKRDCDKIC